MGTSVQLFRIALCTVLSAVFVCLGYPGYLGFLAEVPQPVVQQQLPAGCPELIQKVRPFGSFSLQAVRCYSQCDCPTLGGPQPDVVIVEYDEDEVDR